MRFRTLAAGAGMLAALTFAATSPTPAEIGAKTSATTHTRTAKPAHRAARPQRDAKGRHGKRTRVARHHHRQPTDRNNPNARRPLASARAESTVPVRQETAAERRFREFLTPQSFAAIVNEPLRTPRLLAAQFSGDSADPELVFANATAPVASDPRAEAPPVEAREQTTADDSRSKVAPIAHSDPVPVERANQTDKQTEGMSFLRWFFIAWGGVLTLASAVRLAIG